MKETKLTLEHLLLIPKAYRNDTLDLFIRHYKKVIKQLGITPDHLKVTSFPKTINPTT